MPTPPPPGDRLGRFPQQSLISAFCPLPHPDLYLPGGEGDTLVRGPDLRPGGPDRDLGHVTPPRVTLLRGGAGLGRDRARGDDRGRDRARGMVAAVATTAARARPRREDTAAIGQDRARGIAAAGADRGRGLRETEGGTYELYEIIVNRF